MLALGAVVLLLPGRRRENPVGHGDRAVDAAAVRHLRAPDELAGVGIDREEPTARARDVHAAVGDDRRAGEVAAAAVLHRREGPRLLQRWHAGGRDDLL